MKTRTLTFPALILIATVTIIPAAARWQPETFETKGSAAPRQANSGLLRLAGERFQPLGKPGIIFFTHTEKGQCVAFDNGNQAVLTAADIEWICTDPNVSKHIPHTGIHIKGARIEGELNLSLCRHPFPSVF